MGVLMGRLAALVAAVALVLLIAIIAMLVSPQPRADAILASMAPYPGGETEPGGGGAYPAEINETENGYTIVVNISNSSGKTAFYNLYFPLLFDRAKPLSVYFENDAGIVSQCSYRNLKIPEKLESYAFDCKLPEQNEEDAWKDRLWKDAKQMKMRWGALGK